MPTGQPRSAAADRRSATVRAGRARVGAANQKALRGVERGDQDVPRARRMIRRHSFSGNCTARQARTPLSERSAAADAMCSARETATAPLPRATSGEAAREHRRPSCDRERPGLARGGRRSAAARARRVTASSSATIRAAFRTGVFGRLPPLDLLHIRLISVGTIE